MNPDGDGDGGARRRALRIDLDELCWALNSRDPYGLGSHWLDLESGALLFVSEADAPHEGNVDPRDDERWLRIAPVESFEVFRIMEDFVDQCDDARLADALAQALRQRHPFRRFKDRLLDQPAQRAAWFAFEREAMAAIARRWCEDHGITPTWIVHRPAPPS